MRTCEWVVVAYFLYLLISGCLLGASRRTLARVCAVALFTCAVIALLAAVHQVPGIAVLRDWLPGGWVLAGYWATGLLYRGPNTALESALDSVDRRLFELVGAWHMPRLLRESLEFAYLFCYPLVPAGVGALYLLGQRRGADAFWTIVLTAAFAAYAVLPWAGTRPPRSLPSCPRKPEARSPQLPGIESRASSEIGFPTSATFFQRVNLSVLAKGSIQVNTFPSGHAASAWAVALVMTGVPGAPWPLFVAIAAGIGVGAVVGRYHYFLDVVAGTAVAVLVFLAGRLMMG